MVVSTELAQARRWWILVVVSLATLMVALDATVINIALPRAQLTLHFSNANRQWLITAYALSFGSLLLLGGRLSDLWGRRTTLYLGLSGFALASALGGSAHSFTMLVVARAIQGLFGALLAPAALATLTTTFQEPGERARALPSTEQSPDRAPRSGSARWGAHRMGVVAVVSFHQPLLRHVCVTRRAALRALGQGRAASAPRRARDRARQRWALLRGLRARPRGDRELG